MFEDGFAIFNDGLLRGCESIVGKVSSIGIGEDIEPYVRGVTFESRVPLGDTWVCPPRAAVPAENDDGNGWRGERRRLVAEDLFEATDLLSVLLGGEVEAFTASEDVV